MYQGPETKQPNWTLIFSVWNAEREAEESLLSSCLDWKIAEFWLAQTCFCLASQIIMSMQYFCFLLPYTGKEFVIMLCLVMLT